MSTFPDNPSVPPSRVKQSKKKAADTGCGWRQVSRELERGKWRQGGLTPSFRKYRSVPGLLLWKLDPSRWDQEVVTKRRYQTILRCVTQTMEELISTAAEPKITNIHPSPVKRRVQSTLIIVMCDAPCMFVCECIYFTNICTITSLLYTPRLHVSTYSVIIRAFKIYQRF
jgi:hypothetical protein